MSRQQTAMSPPVHVGLPLADPAPTPDCARCEQWARERATARAAHDAARVSDCNVQIRRCTH